MPKRQFAYQVTLPDGRVQRVNIARRLKAPRGYVFPSSYNKGVWLLAALAEADDVRYGAYKTCEAKAA